MKILFSADWHIKLGQKNVPVNWARARYDSFFHQIYLLEDDADLHIIGGDIFDRVPTIEELELYFTFVKGCQIETLIYDGNHEATKKNKTFFTALKEVTHSLNDKVTIIDEAYEDERGFSILPYCDLHKKNSIEMLNKEDWDWYWEKLELPQLIRKTVSNPNDMITGLYDHVIYELEGDLGDLAKVGSSDLLDKKVVKRSSEATLVLDKEFSVGEELVEYLTYVLEIAEDKIPEILGLYNDYAKNLEVE